MRAATLWPGRCASPSSLKISLRWRGGRAIPIALDVTDDAGVGPAVATAIAAAGGLDILVNNAGYALMGPIEDIGLPEAWCEIETNFFGVLKLSQAVLPHFRAQNAGRIINIGSVA